jgi:hypothetical protein
VPWSVFHLVINIVYLFSGLAILFQKIYPKENTLRMYEKISYEMAYQSIVLGAECGGTYL